MRLKSLFFLFFLICALGFTQAPEKFTYQSVIKNSSGYLLKNQEIGLRISILFNSSNGMSVYSEEHSVESNSNGLVTLIIGEGVTSDVFNDIDWGNGEYYLKVEVDTEGGINYTMNQTSQLLSVPYALYAGNSNTNINLLGQDYITLNNQTLTINKIDLSDDVEGILSVNNGGTGTSTAAMIGVITAADAPAARLALGLGTAATTALTDYATAAQGALADTALQDATAFATAAQGALADTALQDATVFATAAQGALADTALQDATAFATAAQGALADTALQDATVFATAAQGALADTALQDASVFATAAQGALADTALQASNNLSDITNIVAARTALGVDVSGTDNSTNVSLAGSLDYLTLSGQAITLGQVDYDTDISNKPTLLQLGTTSNTALAGNTTTISSSQSSAITANTAKTTNVSTDLTISGTTGARTIESSDGTDAIIPIATTSVSGLLSPSLFDEIAANTAKTGITSVQSSAITANTAKTTNVSTDLTISGTTGARTIESSDGTDAIIPIATTSVSGLLSPSLFDEIAANTAKTGITSVQSSAITANTAKTTNVSTDLTISGTTGARTIESSDGTDAIIPIATTSVSGLLSPSLFDEIAANTAKTGITSVQSSAITANTAKTTNVSTDLTISGTTGARTIESSDGTDAIIPIATTSVSGLLSPSLFDEIAANTAKTGITSVQSSAITANTAKTTNVSTDLTISGTTGARTIESSDGTDAIIPIATTSVSGLLSPSLFDEIAANTAKTGITSVQSSAITANTAKTTNVSTDLTISGTTGARTIESSDGTDAIIPIATTSVSGLLSPSLFDEIAANTAKETNVSTNLSSTTAEAQITINSSDGNNVVIAEATNSIAGLMSTTHHDKLDSLISGIITMDGVTSVVANVPGITTNSIVTVSFKSGKNGRDIVSVVPNTDTITITLSNTSSSNAKVMYIAIK
jgi:predicted secreted Zn-dependent protease